MMWFYALIGLVTVVGLAGCANGLRHSAGLAERFAPTGQFTEIEGVRLHHEVSGPQGAPVVLVLHGASGNLHEPKLALDEVLSAYRVYWLDRPGLGWSERPTGGGAWTPQREAALIRSFLAEQGVDEAYVIGHSWGAAISLRLLLDHSDVMAGAVLVAPAVRANVGDAAFYNNLTGWPVVGSLMTRIVVPAIGPGSLEGGAQNSFSPAPLPEGYVEDTYLPLILRPGPWRANAADMARVNLSLEEQETRYDEIAQPVIIVAGPDDSVVLTNRHALPVSQTVQNGELRLIEGEGHNPHHGHPDAVAQALADVMEQSR